MNRGGGRGEDPRDRQLTDREDRVQRRCRAALSSVHTPGKAVTGDYSDILRHKFRGPVDVVGFPPAAARAGAPAPRRTPGRGWALGSLLVDI